MGVEVEPLRETVSTANKAEWAAADKCGCLPARLLESLGQGVVGLTQYVSRLKDTERDRVEAG